KIEQDAQHARVTFIDKGGRQTMTADRILCAVPYTVLRNVELPSNFSARKVEIINKLEYANVSRVYLQAKKRSWEEKGLNEFAITNDAIEIWQPTWNQPGPRGILMTYNRPGQAERIAAMPESERISSTLSRLGQWFPGL